MRARRRKHHQDDLSDSCLSLALQSLSAWSESERSQPLSTAVYAGDVQLVCQLLQHKVHLSSKETTLIANCVREYSEPTERCQDMVSLLLTSCAGVTPSMTQSAIVWAIYRHDVAIVQLLLSYNSDTSDNDLIHAAVGCVDRADARAAIIDLLLKHKAEINGTQRARPSAARHAKALLGHNVDASPSRGRCALRSLSV